MNEQLTSKERNILDLAKNLQDDLHVYCKGAAGSGDNFYARTFANLADRADELVKLLESAPETSERHVCWACQATYAGPRAGGKCSRCASGADPVRAVAWVGFPADQPKPDYDIAYDEVSKLPGHQYTAVYWQPPAPKASEPRPCPIPEADGFDIQGKEIGPGIWGVGKANWHPESGDWRGLADINGGLCVVTLKVTPSSEPE